MPLQALFNEAELRAAFSLILPTPVAVRAAREWFEQVAGEVDEEGRFLYQDWHELVDRPRGTPDGVVRVSVKRTRAEADLAEQDYFRRMSVPDRLDLVMRFSGFHFDLVALVSDDLWRRMKDARGWSDGRAERRRTQMRRVVSAMQTNLDQGVG